MYVPADLRPGDILLMTEGQGNFLARSLDRMIVWSTANPFVHAAIVGEGHLIDPVWRVERGPLDRYRGNGWRLRPRVPEEIRALAVRWAERRVGNVYGVREILADFARYDLHFVRPRWYRWRPDHWTCSGFVTAAYAAAGHSLTLAPAPSPGDLSYSPLLVGPRPWGRGRSAGPEPSGKWPAA